MTSYVAHGGRPQGLGTVGHKVDGIALSFEPSPERAPPSSARPRRPGCARVRSSRLDPFGGLYLVPHESRMKKETHRQSVTHRALTFRLRCSASPRGAADQALPRTKEATECRETLLAGLAGRRDRRDRDRGRICVESAPRHPSGTAPHPTRTAPSDAGPLPASASTARSSAAAVPFDPGNFVPGAPIDNAYFPLPVGRALVYRGAKDGQTQRDVVRVTAKTRMIDGVLADRGERRREAPPDPARADHRLLRPGQAGQRLVPGRAHGRVRAGTASATRPARGWRA